MSFKNDIVLLRSHLDEAEAHLNKLEGGVKASSSKARVSLLKIKTLTHQLRKDITDKLKQMPTKTRLKNVVEAVAVEPVAVEQPEEPESVPESVRPVPITKVRKPRAKKVVKSE
jgi:hypothetical protein